MRNASNTITPRVVTQAQFDDSTLPASTAFLRASGFAFAGVNSYSSGQTLTAAADIGKTIICGGAGPYTHNVPLTTSSPAGKSMLIMSQGATVTLARQGGDTFAIAGVTGLTSFIIGGGDWVWLTNYNGTDTWIVTGGTPLMQRNATSGVFGATLSTTGYHKLPSGIIVQRGTITNNASADVTVTFPIAFPADVFAVLMTPQASGSGAFCSTHSIALSSFQFSTWTATSTRATATSNGWLAIGR